MRYKMLDEIHRIRENIYEEEKDMSDKEALERLHERVEKIVNERNLKVKFDSGVSASNETKNSN